MVEQDNFIYSPLGKASEKERKIIQNQGIKQIKATEEHGKQLPESKAPIQKYDYNVKNHSLSIVKQKQIFNKRVNKRRDEILKLSKRINYDGLTYHHKG